MRGCSWKACSLPWNKDRQLLLERSTFVKELRTQGFVELEPEVTFLNSVLDQEFHHVILVSLERSCVIPGDNLTFRARLLGKVGKDSQQKKKPAQGHPIQSRIHPQLENRSTNEKKNDPENESRAFFFAAPHPLEMETFFRRFQTALAANRMGSVDKATQLWLELSPIGRHLPTLPYRVCSGNNKRFSKSLNRLMNLSLCPKRCLSIRSKLHSSWTWRRQ